MEQLIQLLKDSRIKISLIYFFIAIAIWFAGPYIAIANYKILSTSDHRLILALLLAVMWGLHSIRITIKSDKSKAHSKSTITPGYIDESKQIFNTVKFNLKYIIQKNLLLSYVKKTPVNLVIGCERSGRSYLLAEALKQPYKPMGDSRYMQSWKIHGGNYLDISYDNKLVWETVIATLGKFKSKIFVKGIIVTINLPRFCLQDSLLELQNISAQLQFIIQHFKKNAAIHLVFTHSDHVHGFCDFFDDLTLEQRTKPFGFTLGTRYEGLFIDHCSKQFDNFLSKLNEKLVLRFHQELNIQKRIRIKDFLLQLELVKEPLIKLFAQWQKFKNLRVADCFFVSSTQIGTPINLINRPLEQALNIKMSENLGYYKKPDKSYFLEELFTHVFTKNNTKNRNNNIYYLISVLLILSFTFYWSINFATESRNISELKTAIDHNKAKPINNFYYLPHLTLLYNQLYHKSPAAHLLKLLSINESTKINAATEKTYLTLLRQQYIPALQSFTTNEVVSAGMNNPSRLYGALKAYLMLSDLSHRDTNFLRYWFDQYWLQNVSDKKTRQQLITQLNVVLDKNIAGNANPEVIASSRAVLEQIPLPQLSFSVLLDQYQQPLKIVDNNSAIQIAKNYWIPTLFSRAEFNTIYTQKIPQATQEVIDGNWVLGKKTPISPEGALQLTQAIQAIYVESYINAWNTLLTKIALPDFQNLKQVTDFTKIITKSDSPLFQLLNTINLNTSDNKNINPAFELINSHFEFVNQFMKNSSFVNFQITLNQLNEYFQANNLNTNAHAAYIAATKRMESLGYSDPLENAMQQFSHLPYPLANWLGNLPNQAWHFILSDAQDYLNQMWQTQVIPKYNETINNRYPVFKTAKQESTLNDFTYFFAPKGVLDSFFTEYLKPFVDTTRVYWTWKIVDNDHINIPATTLEMFIRASLIQKMYFSENTNKPLVKFTLIPQALEPGVTSFDLNLEGQNVHFLSNQNATQLIPLIWPGSAPNKVTIQFNNVKNKPAVLTQKGPWAWFKVLDRGNIQTTLNNPKQFEIMFDLNGNSVRYQLIAENLINPFIPGIVTAFRCPESL